MHNLPGVRVQSILPADPTSRTNGRALYQIKRLFPSEWRVSTLTTLSNLSLSCINVYKREAVCARPCQGYCSRHEVLRWAHRKYLNSNYEICAWKNYSSTIARKCELGKITDLLPKLHRRWNSLNLLRKNGSLGKLRIYYRIEFVGCINLFIL